MNVRPLMFSSFSLWIAIGLFSIYLLYPLRNTLRFGIDLVGGTYITLEAQTEKAVESVLFERLRKVTDILGSSNKMFLDKKIEFEFDNTKKSIVKQNIILMFDSIGQAQDATMLIKNAKIDIVCKVEQNQLHINLSDSAIKQISNDAVERNIEVLRTRLDRMSVAEIAIARQGDRQIVVELPDVSSPQEAKAMIGRAAILEFKPVEKVGSSEEDILFAYDGEIPDDMRILPARENTGRGDQYYLVSRYAEVTGKDLVDARPRFDEREAKVVVDFRLTTEGNDKFFDLTGRYQGRQIAIVLDDIVISAPTVKAGVTRVRDGNYYIDGTFTAEQAREFALLLKSGAFVAPVTFEEERQIGPSLGKDSIYKGLLSCVVGFLLIFIFSIFYYKLSGLFAFIALLFNVLFVLLGLSWLHATLTLPGIAGIILTVGMAIDASILIFERIKEELAHGSGVSRAVSTGFSDAMMVILDANITTFIVGIVLYKFGTGPIQGFAVTMMLGIVATLITGLFFLRSLFNAFLNVFTVEKLSI
jgi:preprotein translocase subunit SecD